MFFLQAAEHFAYSPANVQNAEISERFVAAVASYNLTNAEILQILNMRPKSLPHLVTVALLYILVLLPKIVITRVFVLVIYIAWW